MDLNKQGEFGTHDETESIQVDTPTLVATPSIQSTTIERSALEQASSEVSISISSISVETPSLNTHESITSRSEMLSTPATISNMCPRSGQSPTAALSILSFKNTDLRAEVQDDDYRSTSSSISPLPDPTPSSGSDHKTPRLSLIPHESISVNTINEENSKSTQSLVSFGDALGKPASSQYLDEDHFLLHTMSSLEQNMLTSKIEALESELIAARAEAYELVLQLQAEKQRSELVPLCLWPQTMERPVSPMIVSSPPCVEESAVAYGDASIQTNDNTATIIELDKNEYESFMLIAMKLQEENKTLWEQLSAKEKAISFMTENMNALANDVKHLTDQLSIIGDTNLTLQAALKEKTSIIENYEAEQARIVLSDICQQTDVIKCISREVYAIEQAELPVSVDIAQQTSFIQIQSPSSSESEHYAKNEQIDEQKDDQNDNQKSDQAVQAVQDSLDDLDVPQKTLIEMEKQISGKEDELAELIAKIDALGSWYSKEVERLKGIQYVQNEADNMLAISKQEGKQSNLLEIAGSVLPAPSHDGSREAWTITRLIEALNFQSYKDSCASRNVPDCVLVYASEVLPRIIDIQRMLRALQKEYYAYVEQIKANTRTITTLSADNEALRVANAELKESIKMLKSSNNIDKLTKSDLAEQKDNLLQSSLSATKVPVTDLLSQLIPFINDELTKKKALNVDTLEKTIVEQAQLQFSPDLKPDLSTTMNDFSVSADLSINEETMAQLRELVDSGGQVSHEQSVSRWEDYGPLLLVAQAKHQAKQSEADDIGIVSNQPDYKLHYLRSKMDAFIFRHQVLKIFDVFNTLLKESNLQQGTESAFFPDNISELIDDFKSVSTLREHLQEENRKLIDTVEYRNRRVNELETILLALYQQSTHFFRTYKSVLDKAIISLVKQDSLLMHSDMGAISMILLHAKVCLENSVNDSIKDAVIRAFNEQPHSQITTSSRANVLNSVDAISGDRDTSHCLPLTASNRESSMRPLLQVDARPSFLLSHCDPTASQSQAPEDTSKHTPLMQAVIEGNYNNITSALITKYACKQDSAGMTALMHAVVHRRFGLISKLAVSEAGIALPDGRTALFLAIELKYMDIAEELRQYEGVPVARVPVPHGEQKHVQAKKGGQSRRESFGPANMEASHRGKITGLTNLMAAAEKNDLVTVWILIPNEGCIQDSKGRTALMYAAYAGNLRVTELLLQFEARMQDCNGCTALMYAVQAGNVELVKLLANAESRIINNTFSTALMMAARLKSEQMMNVLAPLECGIQGYSSSTTRFLPVSPRTRRGSINPQNFFTADAHGSGVTALMISANVGFKYGVTLLLNEELSLRDRNGYSAYDYAIYGKGDEHLQKEIAYLLRE